MPRTKNAAPKKPKPTKGVDNYSELGSWLWSAAGKIRGPVDAPRYKDYILPLLFLKRLSDRYDDEVAVIAEKFSKGDLTKAEAMVVKDQKLVTFVVPKSSRWSEVVRPTGSGESLGARVTTALRGLAKASPRLDFMANAIDFNAETEGQRTLDDARLRTLLSTLSERRLGLKDCEPDMLGRAYEYLLQRFSEEGAQSGGEFFTPRSAAMLMARLLDPQPGMSVYDPTCGSAGLLVKCQMHWKANHFSGKGKVAPLHLHGQEQLPVTYVIAKMNAILHDMEADIRLGDTMANPRFLDKRGRLQRFDRVVANPQWNQEFPESVYANDTYNRFSFGSDYPPSSTADWGWIQHMLASLAPRGRMAVVIDTGAASRGSEGSDNSRERSIRADVIKKDLVEAVILMPENMFANTIAPAHVITFSLSKAHPGEIIFVDASKKFSRGRPKNELSALHEAEIANAVVNWKTIHGFTSIKSNDDVTSSGFSLSPQRYIQYPIQKPTIALDEALAALSRAEQARSLSDVELKQALSRIGLSWGKIGDQDNG